jgi:hypothetical protein
VSRHRYTGSRADLASRCLYWARGDVAAPPRDSSSATDLGSALHEAAADEGGLDALEDIGGLLPALAERQEHVDDIAERWGLTETARTELELLIDAWRAWWPSYAGARAFRTEVPFAFDPRSMTARELPSNGQRDYSACEGDELPTTLDAYALEGDRVVVLDLKTGRGVKRVADYRRQLLVGAVCASFAHDVGEATIVLAHVTPDGVFVDQEDVDTFDLHAEALALRDEVARIPSAEPVPGSHCAERRCPMRPWCPMTTRHLPVIVDTPAARLPLVGALEQPDAARVLLDVLPRVEAWVEERRRALRTFVDERGAVDLDGGRVFGRFEEARETPRLDVVGAIDAMRSVLGDLADAAIERKTTKAAIERAARTLVNRRGGRRGELKIVREAVLNALRGARAMKVSRYPHYEIRTVRDRSLEEADHG